MKKYNIRYRVNGEIVEKKDITWKEVQEFIDNLEREDESELNVKQIKEDMDNER